MPRFKVLAGEHIQNDYDKEGKVVATKVWKKGEVFSCKEDLDKKFENKFERIGGETLAAETFNSPMDQTHVLDQPFQAIEAAKAEGKHVVPDNDPPPVPAIPGSDPRMAAKKESEGTADVAEGDPDHPDSEDDGESEFGKDVTEKFKGAKDKDVKVMYSKDGGYVVVDSDDPKTKLSKKKLADRKAVSKFLTDFK